MGTPFDRALERRDRAASAQAYALGYGEPGSREYRAAWLRFRHNLRTPGNPQVSLPALSEADARVVGVLNAAIERAILIDGAAMANVQLLDAESEGLRLVAHSGFPAPFLKYFGLVADTTSACGSALTSGRSTLVSDITRSTIFAGTQSLEVMLDAGSRAVASIPVSSTNGQLIGMLSTHHGRPARWTRSRILGLEHLARSTGRLLDYLLAQNGKAE